MENDTLAYIAAVLGVVVLLLAIVVGVPFAVFWAINTLFGIKIQFTFWTWLAFWILWIVFIAKIRRGD